MPAGEQMGDGHDPRCHGADDCTCDCWSCEDQRSHEPAPDPECRKARIANLEAQCVELLGRGEGLRQKYVLRVAFLEAEVATLREVLTWSSPSHPNWTEFVAAVRDARVGR